jgi:hypothetical protein
MNGKARDLALVDVCATSDRWTGARARWKPDDLTDLFVTTASRCDRTVGYRRPQLPVERAAPRGVRLRLCAAGRGMMTVRVPIAPGLIAPVGIAEACPCVPVKSTLSTPNAVCWLSTASGRSSLGR